MRTCSPPGRGRPSLPATQMAAVLVLQVLHDYSDRETAEAVKFDMRWKVAIGASLDDPGFDPSWLVYWRNRIAKSERPHRVSDAVKTLIGQTGILKGRRRRAVAACSDTGIITDEKLTGASGEENSDAAVAAEFVAAEPAAAGHDGDHDEAGGRLAWYGDSAYGTGDLRQAITAAGHQAVIKPWPLLPAVEGGFTADDFTADAAAGTVTCPAGITRHLTAANAVIFEAACRACPADP